MFKKLASKLIPFSKNEPSLLHTTDLHSHLIPGIDDGVKTVEQSLEIITQLRDLGFTKIITTPHIMSHRFANTKEVIYERYLLLQEALVQNNIEIDLEVAAEYYYDEYFLELVNQDNLMSFGDNYVLFELSYTVKPFMLEQIVSKLLKGGYKPILAHPERYTYYHTETHYRVLKEMGLSFQINLTSTQGFYGKRVKHAVENIIDLGFVDFIGSDIHSQKYLDSFSKALKSRSYVKLFEKNAIKNSYL